MTTTITLPDSPSLPNELAHLPFWAPFNQSDFWNVSLQLKVGERRFDGTGYANTGPDRLAYVHFGFASPISDLDEALTAAWGDAHFADKKRSKLAWFDDAASPSLRFFVTKDVKGSKLTVAPVEPLEKFFSRALALVHGDTELPRLGMTAAEAAEKYGADFRHDKFVIFRPNAFGDFPSQATLFFDAEGRAEKIELTSPVGPLDAVKRLQKAIKAFADAQGIELMPKRYTGAVVRDGKRIEIGTTATATSGTVRFALSAAPA